jgi:hypothetical protein
VREYEACGFRIALKQQTIGKRSATCDVTEEELPKIPKENIISQQPKEPAKFEMEEPPSILSPGDDPKAHAKAQQEYRAAKERFEAAHADDPPMVTLNLWVPVKVTLQVLMDGHEVKIFHTLRGPVMGLVKSEDLHRAYLYSPCFIDPNIERGRVHYLPIAFAGFEFTLYKGGIGESTPQEAEIEGYPYFVERNRKGDYTFRMKAAYHHIDADYPEDAKLISADGEPRDALMGLVATSDTREQKLVDRARQVKALQEQQERAAQAAEEAPPVPQAERKAPDSEDTAEVSDAEVEGSVPPPQDVPVEEPAAAE